MLNRKQSLAILLSVMLHHFIAASVGDPSRTGSSSSTSLVQDYCQWEAFNASCPFGHVIVMESAKFGRMRLGRCVDTDIYIGCAADVLALFDARCSGRPSCVVQLPDATLHQQQACPKDVVAYLEASYVCVDASQVQPVDCAALTPPKLVADNENFVSFRKTDEDVSGYLASYYAQTLGHGRPDCPWTIAVRPGQRIQLTLIDFSADARYGVDGGHHESGPPASAASAVDPAVPDFCYRYAQVSEGLSTSRRYTVCAEETREQVVYTSSSNVLNVEITDTVLADVAINFLIKYTAVGCANLKPPADAWVERTGDRTTVSCNKTSQSWHLVCKGTTWVGPHTHDCRHGSPFGEKITDDSPFPTYGLVIAVIIGVVVGSVCGFLLLALVLSCRRQRAYRRSRATAMTADIPLMLAPPSEQSEHVCKLHGVATTGAGGQGQYGYTHVWQLRSAPDVATVGGEYQATAADNGLDTTPRQRDAGRTRRDHLYDCPLFDDRLLTRMQTTGNHTHSHSPGCRRHQPLYQQHHTLCPHGRQPLPVSSPLPPTSAAAGDGSPSDVGGDESQDGGGGGAAMDDVLPAPSRSRQGGGDPLTTTVAPCRTDDAVVTLPPPPPPDVTASKSTKAPQNHYL